MFVRRERVSERERERESQRNNIMKEKKML